MKYGLYLFCLLLAGALASDAQTSASADCDCASCKAKAEGTFTLPGLQGLQDQDAESDDYADHDHAAEESGHDDHAGHDHGAEEDGHEDHAGHDHGAEGDGLDHDDDHEGHDHSAEEGGHDDHAEYDHGDEATEVMISEEMVHKSEILVQMAKGGTIARTTVFPAEIKLNRDRTAAVSPRYASIVRQVFAEIGDTVNKGDVLASLENRETMAVYTVAAPLNGVIISKDLAVGETAGEERLLYEVADLSSVWADISVFPKYQHLLRKDMRVTFVAHDGHTAEGIVRYISPIISHETRTFTARCILEAPSEDFTPGAFVRAELILDSVEAAVAIPRDAVQHIDGEAVVFVPSENGFSPVSVELGLLDNDYAEIINGLEPGDSFVGSGAFILKAAMVTGGMDPHAGHSH
jgi:cobalt-zinc-cadmium efflux system membrane fusion protein